MINSIQSIILCVLYAALYYQSAKLLYPFKRSPVPAGLSFVIAMSILLHKLDSTKLLHFIGIAFFVGIFFAFYLEDKRCIRCAVVEFVLSTLLARLLTTAALLLFTQNMMDYRQYFLSTDYRVFFLFAILLILISKLKTIFIVSEKLKRLRKDEVRFIAMINFIILLLTVVLSDLYVKLIGRHWIEIAQIKSIQIVLILGIFLFVIICLFIRSFITVLFYSNIKYRVLNERASADSLTGVLTREAGLKTLKRIMREAEMKSKPLTIGFVDINNLKVVNDKFGHPEGDRLIEIISNHMKENLRQTEYVCRMGGDEFLIIFSHSTLPVAHKIWKRIMDSITHYNDSKQHPYEIGVSIGFAVYDPSKHANVKDFIGEADQEMYKNKRLTKRGR